MEILFISREEAELLPARPPQGFDQSYADSFKRIRDSRGSLFDKRERVGAE